MTALSRDGWDRNEWAICSLVLRRSGRHGRCMRGPSAVLRQGKGVGGNRQVRPAMWARLVSADIELVDDEVRELTDAASRIDIKGDRYNETMQQMINR